MKKKKLSLNELKVKSFVTGDKVQTDTIKGGTIIGVTIGVSIVANCTGNCGTAINVTCAQGCDFPTIPLNECFGSGNCGSNNCSGPDCGGGGGSDIIDCKWPV